MSKKVQRTYTQRQESIPLEELSEQWRPAFDKFDHDNDGVVPLHEFRHLIKSTPLASEIPDDVLDDIIDKADRDHNGELDFNEFLLMIRARELGNARPVFRRMIEYAAFVTIPTSRRRSEVRRYLNEYSCCPPPLFMITITLIEIAVFTYYVVTNKQGPLDAVGPIPFDSVLIYNPHRRYEAWRFLSYMLMHAGVVHIFFNLVMQLLLGVPLEMVHGWWRLMIVYFAGVIAGSLGTSISDPYTYLLGASAGVYAVLFAHLASVMLTGYAAHIAGGLTGLLVGITVLRNLRVLTWEKVCWWTSLVLFFLAITSMIIINVAVPSYFPPQEH